MSVVANHLEKPKTKNQSTNSPHRESQSLIDSKPIWSENSLNLDQDSLLDDASNSFLSQESLFPASEFSASGDGSSSSAISEQDSPSLDSTDQPTVAIPEMEVLQSESITENQAIAASNEEANAYPSSPYEDPAFNGIVNASEQVAAQTSKHENPDVESQRAQRAAPIAANESTGAAQASQVESMNEQEPNEFDAVGFKTKLMERIATMQMPKTLEEADNFEKHSNINDINHAANQDVGIAQANAAGPIVSATQAEPNTGVVPVREVVDLPEADLGTTPHSIGANSAMPTPRPESQVSQPLQENMGKVDDVMAENEVTDDMLANSNEPSFTGALAQTNEARAHTESAPQDLRAQEGSTLSNAQQNAENQSNSQLQNMQNDREGIFGMLSNQQTQTATQDTSERTRIASEIDAIYSKAKTDVELILDELETKVSEKFTAASERAKKAFEKYVADEMRAYKEKRYDVVGGSLLWAKDKLLGMPKEVEKFFVKGRQVFIDHMDKELAVISEYVAQQLNAAKDRIAKGRQEVAVYVAELPENLQSIGQEAADAIQDQFDSLQDSVNEKQDALIESLAQQYSSALEEVDARIEEMKAENAGLIDAVMGTIMAVIETIINIKNMLLNLLAKAIQAIGTIISDPIGFLTNFFGGIKLGFEQFGTNILKHLQAGFLTWLTGAMSGINLQMPDDIFSLKGIFSLTCQILGFTWDRVRAIGVKVIGEPIIKALEVGFDIVMILKNEGIAGLWEYLKDQFNDLKATVMDAIMDMIQSQVIQAGIKWILGLLSPVGAFIKACMAIIDVVVFFVQKAKQIIELIDAFLDAILAVASGSVGAVANLIENALSRAVPVLIGFLASLLGISGLASKVTKIFQKIQQRVEKAVTKLWVKLKEMGTAFLGALGIRGEQEEGESNDVKEITKNRLLQLLGPEASQEEARQKTSQVLVELEPQGLQNLQVNPDSQEENVLLIDATASPVEHLLKLTPRFTRTRPAVVLAVRITLSPYESFRVATEEREIIPGFVRPYVSEGQPGNAPGTVETRNYPRNHPESGEFQFGSITTGGRVSGGVGGAILIPQTPSNVVELVTWSNGGLNTNVCHNDSHAEHQFVNWFLVQSHSFKAGVQRIDLILRDLSPCSSCVGDLIRIVNNENISTSAVFNLSWRKVFETRGNCLELNTTNESLNRLQAAGWNLSGPFPNEEPANSQELSVEQL